MDLPVFKSRTGLDIGHRRDYDGFHILLLA